MIGSLRGTIIDRDPAVDKSGVSQVLVEVAGIGYRVNVVASTLSRLHIGDEALLYVHHRSVETGQYLYGFQTQTDRTAFESLLTASGVGPSLAMAVLATFSSRQLAEILAEGDEAALCQVPGMGKAKAKKLNANLSAATLARLVEPHRLGDSTPGSGGGSDAVGAGLGGFAGPMSDVQEALANLGYSGAEMKKALASLPSAAEIDEARLDAGQLLKMALRSLAGS